MIDTIVTLGIVQQIVHEDVSRRHLKIAFAPSAPIGFSLSAKHRSTVLCSSASTIDFVPSHPIPLLSRFNISRVLFSCKDAASKFAPLSPIELPAKLSSINVVLCFNDWDIKCTPYWDLTLWHGITAGWRRWGESRTSSGITTPGFCNPLERGKRQEELQARLAVGFSFVHS